MTIVYIVIINVCLFYSMKIVLCIYIGVVFFQVNIKETIPLYYRTLVKGGITIVDIPSPSKDNIDDELPEVSETVLALAPPLEDTFEDAERSDDRDGSLGSKLFISYICSLVSIL